MAKREYIKFETILFTGLELESPVLVGSIGRNATISSVGQEIGETYDFDSANNTFNHEWESGTITH